MKILFVGGGNMASAMIGGLIQQGLAARDIAVVEIAQVARERLQANFGVAVFADAASATRDAELLVLAVKPQQMREVARGFARRVQGALVVSIAAGIRTTDLSRWLSGYGHIVRVMPNTPALVRQGIAGLYAMREVGAEARSKAERLMRSVGETIWFDDESALDAVTAVSGSGPAYVFYFIEALQRAALELGLPPDSARRLALATFSGAAKLALDSADDPATLRAKVTSKGGTTERALAEMESARLGEGFTQAVRTAAERSRELGDEFGKGD
jgi:pyrroline-5-carboxylate reductase